MLNKYLGVILGTIIKVVMCFALILLCTPAMMLGWLFNEERAFKTFAENIIRKIHEL